MLNTVVDVLVQGAGAGALSRFVKGVSPTDVVIFSLASASLTQLFEQYCGQKQGNESYYQLVQSQFLSNSIVAAVSWFIFNRSMKDIALCVQAVTFGDNTSRSFRWLFPIDEQGEQRIQGRRPTLWELNQLFLPLLKLGQMYAPSRIFHVKVEQIAGIFAISNWTHTAYTTALYQLDKANLLNKPK